MSTASTGGVLVADDDVDIRLLVAAIAEQAGWHVETVGDGRAALDAASGTWPDAFVLDVNMPGLSGIEVCRALRRAPATENVPVVLMSAETSPANIAASYRAGCDRFMPKPFSRQQLLDALDEIRA